MVNNYIKINDVLTWWGLIHICFTVETDFAGVGFRRIEEALANVSFFQTVVPECFLPAKSPDPPVSQGVLVAAY